MIPLGDDFGFINGRADFQKFDELKEELGKYAESQGYTVNIKYDSLYNYYEALKQQSLEYGLFKGDFLPFFESTPSWDW